MSQLGEGEQAVAEVKLVEIGLGEAQAVTGAAAAVEPALMGLQLLLQVGWQRVSRHQACSFSLVS